jgi:class 3 adenylate cyclase
MPDEAMRCRIDFVCKVISLDDSTGEFVFQLVPDPRRYEWETMDGEKVLYDKFDNAVFSQTALAQFREQLSGCPMYFQPPMIDDPEEYVRGREESIQAQLSGHEDPASFEDKSEAFLESLAVDRLGFVIMCVDIVGSTTLATRLESGKYGRLVAVVLREMSEVIPLFHGHVLKYTGDGLIAYFPEPSFITKHDLALDCALTVRRLVYNCLNPIFVSEGYPAIGIRIGLDSGEACVMTIGSPETKQHKDIIGAVVSLAAKIQSLASPGGIFLGEVTERNLHTRWRVMCERVTPGEDWEYEDNTGQRYGVHRLKD